MTTLIPRDPYSPKELEQLYPKELQLKQVQILARHGERTPTSDRFQHLGLPIYWPYCSVARTMINKVMTKSPSSVSSTFESFDWIRKIEAAGPNDQPGFPRGAEGKIDGICLSGELTDKGRETTFALGTRLRKLYIDQLGFMPDSIRDANTIYLRSTHMSRALESLQQAFAGMYPSQQRGPDFKPVIVTRRYQDDQLYPNNNGCARFGQLYKLFSKRAGVIWDNSPEMDYINSKLRRHMPDKNVVAVNGHPAISGIMDTNNARRAHGPGVALPSEFNDPRVLENIDKIAVDEWYSGYLQNREYRMVGIGGLVGDIVGRIIENVEGSPKSVQFALSGCHDTTLAGFLSSFGAFQGESWPPFTSHIALELFEKKDKASNVSRSRFGGLLPGPQPIGHTPTPNLSTRQKSLLDNHFVRVRYNDRPMTIPGCRAAGKHLEGDESFCTLAAFKEIADKFTPQDWKSACSSNLDKGILEHETIDGGY